MNLLFKVSVRYGVLAAIIGSCLLIGLYYLHRHPFLIPVYVDFRIILFGVFIFFTLREIKDYYQNGYLYFWQGIFASILFTSVYAIVSSLVVYVFTSAVPEFLNDYVNLSIQQLKSLPPDVIEKIGKDVYLRNMAALPSANASDLALLYFSQCFLISLFISVILSVILRRHPKP
ncbi:MAG TPA: DUF4199 domain-containing protein [Chryseosolibacter sp.]